MLNQLEIDEQPTLVVTKGKQSPETSKLPEQKPVKIATLFVPPITSYNEEIVSVHCGGTLGYWMQGWTILCKAGNLGILSPK